MNLTIEFISISIVLIQYIIIGEVEPYFVIFIYLNFLGKQSTDCFGNRYNIYYYDFLFFNYIVFCEQIVSDRNMAESRTVQSMMKDYQSEISKKELMQQCGLAETTISFLASMLFLFRASKQCSRHRLWQFLPILLIENKRFESVF